MNNLKHIYLKMIYESIGFLKFNMESYHNFLKNSIKFKNRKIIVEDKNLLIDIPEEFINYCIDHKESLINFNTIKTLMKSSKHYQNIKNITHARLIFLFFFILSCKSPAAHSRIHFLSHLTGFKKCDAKNT